MEPVTIFLTPVESELFKQFQQYHQMFVLMQQYGVFGIRNGTATLHFDSQGIIQKIERHDSLFDVRVKTVV